MIIIALAKFFARLGMDRKDIVEIKSSLQKINIRLSSLEKENIRFSSDLNHLEKDVNNYFEKKEGKKK